MIRPIVSFAAFLVMIVILCWQGCARPDINHNEDNGSKSSVQVSATHSAPIAN